MTPQPPMALDDEEFQRILASVQRPTRYIGGEWNEIVKDPRSVDLRFALAFPDVYEIGMSHLGFRILYPLLNAIDGVAPPDMALPASMSADAQRVLDAQLDACANDALCSARHPRLRERWRAWLASLPRELELVDPQSGAPQRVRLTRDAVRSALRGPLYAPALSAAPAGFA